MRVMRGAVAWRAGCGGLHGARGRSARRPAAGRRRCARRWSRPMTTNPTIMAQRAQLRVARRGRRDRARRPAGRSSPAPPASTRISYPAPAAATAATSAPASTSAYPLFSGGAGPQLVRAANDARRGRPRRPARDRGRHLHRGGRRLHGRDPRPLDRQLNQNQVRVLETNLQATRDRFEVGDLTRTDVAQSEARLALARSSLATAEGRLTASEENYRRVIGELPGELAAAAAAAAAAGDAGRRRSTSRSPTMPISPRSPPRSRAAGFDVAVARADRLPTVSAISQRRRYSTILGTADEQFGGAGIAQHARPAPASASRRAIPLYQGGAGRRARPPGAGAAEPAARARRSRSSGCVVAKHPRRLRHLPGGAGGDRIERRSRSPPTSSRSKARAPSRRSAPATSSTCSTPSRSC